MIEPLAFVLGLAVGAGVMTTLFHWMTGRYIDSSSELLIEISETLLATEETQST